MIHLKRRRDDYQLGIEAGNAWIDKAIQYKGVAGAREEAHSLHDVADKKQFEARGFNTPSSDYYRGIAMTVGSFAYTGYKLDQNPARKVHK